MKRVGKKKPKLSKLSKIGNKKKNVSVVTLNI